MMDIPAVGRTGVLAMGYGLMLCVLPLFAPLASSSLTSPFYHSHYFFSSSLLFFSFLLSALLPIYPYIACIFFCLYFYTLYNKKKIQANSTNLSLLVTSFLTYLLYPRILPSPHLSIYGLYLFCLYFYTLYNKKDTS